MLYVRLNSYLHHQAAKLGYQVLYTYEQFGILMAAMGRRKCLL